jgi:signal transduction histidine kinase
MWEIPYSCFLIINLCPSWYQTIGFVLLSALLVFFVMWVACRVRLRIVARAIRVRFDERLANQTRIARELHDTMLQTVQGSKFVADAALEKSDDSVHMRLALEKLSMWLGQASQEGQEALNSLLSSRVDHSKSKILRNKKSQNSQE